MVQGSQLYYMLQIILDSVYNFHKPTCLTVASPDISIVSFFFVVLIVSLSFVSSSPTSLSFSAILPGAS